MLNGTKLIKRRDIRPTEPVNMKGALLKDSSLTFFFFFFFFYLFCSSLFFSERAEGGHAGRGEEEKKERGTGRVDGFMYLAAIKKI